MKPQSIINILNSYEKENIRIELKESSKFITSEGRYDGKEMASIIVSFANREGGILIIGAKDGGEFEGPDIFEKFGEPGKAGFDKFKEFVENICKDIISPQIFVTSNFFVIDQNEVAVLTIPKRNSVPHAVVAKHEGSIVRTREYYVRTTHGKGLVSDRHLEWLFTHTNLPKISSENVIEFVFSKRDFRIPSKLGTFERFPTQPEAYQAINEYLNLIVESKRSALLESEYDLQRVFRELLIYAIIQSVDFRSDHLKSLPLPTDNMAVHEFMKDDIIRFLRRKSKLWSVPYGTSMKIKSGKESTQLKFGNKHILGTLSITCLDQMDNLSEINPYAQVFSDSKPSAEYTTFTFLCKFQVDIKYPEDFDDNYDGMLTFAEALQQNIKQKWDVLEHFNSMPHYKLLYEMDYKLDKILNLKR